MLLGAHTHANITRTDVRQCNYPCVYLIYVIFIEYSSSFAPNGLLMCSSYERHTANFIERCAISLYLLNGQKMIFSY
jgi:hypothetical protein